MTKYTLAPTGLSGQTFVTRNADDAAIPPDPENRDWAAYLEWCAAGGVADPEPVAVIDPNIAIGAALQASAASKIATTASLTAPEEAAMFPGGT